MMRHSPCPSLRPCMQDMIGIQAWLLALADSWPSALEPCAARLQTIACHLCEWRMADICPLAGTQHICDIMPFN